MPHHHWPRLKTALTATQAFWLVVSLATFVYCDAYVSGVPIEWVFCIPAVVGYAALALLGFYYSGLLDGRPAERTISPSRWSRILLPAVSLTTVWFVSTRLFGFRGPISALYLACGAVFAVWIRDYGIRFFRHHGLAQRIAILGYGAEARQAAIDLQRHDPHGFEVVAFLVAESAPNADLRAAGSGPAVLAPPELVRFLTASRVRRVLIMAAEYGAALPVHDLLLCRERGITLEHASEFRERVLGRASHATITSMVPTRPAYLLKRGVDVAAAVAILALGAPLIPLVALAIKLEDGGPIFFHQVRMGEAGLRFRLHKLRSMRVDAEAASGPLWAVANDPRSTRVGRWLRALRIDEIPQAWNILTGEMSLVGPRPERPEFEEILRAAIPGYEFRHAVRPGLTGWAQINLPTAATIEHARLKFEYDLYYLRHLSWWLDLQILLRSGKIILHEWEGALAHSGYLQVDA